MGDFKRRIEDWRRYKAERRMEILLKDIVSDGGIYLRPASWFLLQSVEQRRKREEMEKDMLK